MSLARGTNRQFYYTGVISITKLEKKLFLLTDKHFWGFEKTSNSRDTSPLTVKATTTVTETTTPQNNGFNEQMLVYIFLREREITKFKVLWKT